MTQARLRVVWAIREFIKADVEQLIFTIFIMIRKRKLFMSIAILAQFKRWRPMLKIKLCLTFFFS